MTDGNQTHQMTFCT